MAIDKFAVEASHIMMFARAVDDPNPIYADAQYAAGTDIGHLIAPPTFVQASAQFDDQYFLRPKHGQTWFGSAKSPSALMDVPKPEGDSGGEGGGGGGGGAGNAAGLLHAEQHFEYHRHPRPGDVLSATNRAGKSWEKEGKKGGSLKFSEAITEYRDQNGELVVTAIGVSVITSRPAEKG